MKRKPRDRGEGKWPAEPTLAIAGPGGRPTEPAEEPVDAAPPGRLGDYRVHELLGRGGMGEVFRGERADGQFEQQVAIKLLKRGMDSEEILRRFLRERQILAQLTHPGVARLLDGGIAPDGRPFFVLEQVAGVPVTEYVTRQQLPLAQRLALFLDICDAVESAHQRLIVHRDLKPSNILVTAQGQVKLLDFGIAKVLGDTGEPELTRTQLRLMTPAYAAPEQILGEPATTATDVYSLGVVLYELLTGVRPHDRAATSPSGLAAALAGERVERPSAVLKATTPFGRELAGDLDTVVLKALEPTPGRRYPTVAALAQDLRRYLEGRPISARPATWRYQTGKFLRRHKVAVAGAALALTALVVALGVSLWQGDRARRAAVRAERTQDFLISLFRSGDPWQGGSKDVTVGQVLDAAGPKLETELADEPEVRAALEDALAQIYNSLGQLEAAGSLANRGLVARRLHFGTNAPEVGWSLVTRAEIEISRGEPETALATLGEAEAILGELAGEGAEPLLRRHEVRTASLEQAGRSEESLAESERVIELFERRFGEAHPDLGRLYAAHGSNLANLARFPAAEASLRHALALRERFLLPDHPWVVGLKVQLAEVLDSLSRFDEALAMFEHALAAQRRTLGPDHLDLAQTLTKLGFSLSTRGRLRESNEAFGEALSIFERHGHYDAGAVGRYLGFNLFAEHRWQEGGVQFFQAEERLSHSFAPNHPLRHAAVTSTSLALVKLGRLDEAEQRLVPLISGLGRDEGPETNNLRGPLSYLGELYRYQGRIAEALSTHRRQRQIATAVAGTEESMGVAQADFQIALDLAADRPPDLAEARRWLDRSCAYIRDQTPQSTRACECLLTSALMAMREGDRSRAEGEAKAGLALSLERFGAESPLTKDAADIVDRVRRNDASGRIPPWSPTTESRRRR